MMTFLTVVHVMACVLLVLLVLIQSGKGAEISASFGGSSQTVFGSSGGANFFTRFTAGTAVVFMVTSVTLTLLSGQAKKSVFEGEKPTPPAATASPVSQK
jgi:preprotein translocase subunit SecG